MEIANGIWKQSVNDHQTPNVAQLQRQHQGNSSPPTGLERLCKRAAARDNEVIEWEEVRQRQASSTPQRCRQQAGDSKSNYRRQPKGTTLIARWVGLKWKRCLTEAAKGREATMWHNPWDMKMLLLYKKLPKHQATALFLLCTEVLGLDSWLASIGVPNILLQCACGWQA